MRWTRAALVLPAALLLAAAPVPKQLMKEADAARRADLEKLARRYESLTPEAAAPLVKGAVEAGRLDDVAETLALMNTRKAAQLLEALNDPGTVAQVMDRVGQIRARSVAPAPRLVK